MFLTSFLPAGERPAFLTGKVRDLEAQGLSLEKNFAAARAESQDSGNEKVYFTAYEFLSRHRVHRGSYQGLGEGYLVDSKDMKIKIEEKDRHVNRVGTDKDAKDTPAPAALLFLHDGAKKGEITDVTVLDIEETYEFVDVPVFWIGRVENTESLSFMEKSFESAKDNVRLQKNLIFAISCHEGPRAYAVLKNAALGRWDGKVRESAIFWLGNYGDDKSLSDLKEVYRKEQDERIKKQIIFAIQLSKQKEAVEELVRIARQDSSYEARKQAVFWLGQKASGESIKALKEIVEGPAEENKLKDQAVFAISQLPKEKSVPMLIDIARTNKSASVRKKAIFWLGQSGDEAALRFFEEILLKK
jgi:hypothetical protein